MSQDKKPGYYGGFSLYRGGGSGPAPAGAPVMQSAQRQMAAAFNGDWFGVPMMFAPPMPMMAPPVVPPTAASQSAAEAQGRSFPLLGNFFQSANFYKGAPLRAPVPQHNTKPHEKTPAVAVRNAHQPALAPVAKKVAHVPHFNDMWSTFDTVAPTTAGGSVVNLDPIGTRTNHPSSVWAGTPAEPSANAARATSPVLRPFSMWATPTTALKETIQSFTKASLSDDEEEENRLIEQHKAIFSSTDVNSDDEDWLEHLQTTVNAVLSEAEHQALSNTVKKNVDKEWASRATCDLQAA